MKIISNVIVGLSSAEYSEFCKWLSDCCGMSISDLTELPVPRQNQAYEQFLHESLPDDYPYV